MNPEAPTGSSQSSTSSSSFQAQFPNHSQNLPFFSATVKFPMPSPMPFQCVIGLQPLNPYFYQFYPGSSSEGFCSQNPTGPSNFFGSNVGVDLTENRQDLRGQNDRNGHVEKCAFSNQQLDPLTKKCPSVNCVCQGPNGNHIGNGGAKVTKSSTGRNIQNCSTQTNDDVPAIEVAKNSRKFGVQVIRCSAFKPIGNGLPKKSSVNKVVQGQKESDETMQQTEGPHRMEKEPKKSRASIPKVLDISEKDVLNETAKKAIIIRPRAREMFKVISGKTPEKDEEIVRFSAKLVDVESAEDKDVYEPVKKKKKPGPKSKKRY